ncbi:uncharacterized protein AB675_7484 [Cyphellophora attinorum]|uniref:Protein kinase domain-containing protein n=1 Tax=Cyphellophora attinorum TaxID=1664694 RepID=A0A0N1P0E3_9EURO|nr:uncharacterized protein AB675_7484 [Phialophora attinorum]KPI40267.1 hypothetical protein AB675_7484 [Phialophora attinorum]
MAETATTSTTTTSPSQSPPDLPTRSQNLLALNKLFHANRNPTSLFANPQHVTFPTTTTLPFREIGRGTFGAVFEQPGKRHAFKAEIRPDLAYADKFWHLEDEAIAHKAIQAPLTLSRVSALRSTFRG